MKRKIAAIFAADIAGYSRLVAEDEEETLRRLASYRSVTDDFIAKVRRPHFQHRRRRRAGRISECGRSGALRDRHPGKPAHPQHGLSRQPADEFSYRHHHRRVVERDGDLLGDGVNIAARLEGLAEVGGICVSRAVHEQVANKLSVQFADIGAQEVKNIPDAGACLHGGDAARGRNLRDAANQEAAFTPTCRQSELDVAAGGDGGVSRRHRRRRLSVFHQDRDAGARREQVSAASIPVISAPPPPATSAPTPVAAPTTVALAPPPSSAPGQEFAAETVPFVTEQNP